jgi:hypothetical protein
MLQNVILGFSGSNEQPADPADFVIHRDIRGTAEILADPPTPEDDPELRKKSQEEMIAAMKTAYAGKE